MNLRKEPVVLVATLAVVGFMAWSSYGKEPRRASTRRQAKPELAAQPVPDVSLATPAPRDLGRAVRDLFSKPSDTHPLPPLDPEPPPFAPLTGVFPPPLPGPRPAHYGKLLREAATPTAVPALFATDVASAGVTPAEELAGSGAGATGAGPGKPPDEALTAEQRGAQIAGYKRLYDWIRLDERAPMFGHIRNKDKFALKQRVEEPLVFLELDPATGLEMHPGQQPIPYERTRITEFHFAETVSNKILERRRDFGDKVTQGQYPSLMRFADECVEARHAAREALDVAIEMYKLADTVSPNDPAPRLGLARCFELKFDFEAAYAELEALRAKETQAARVEVRLGELEAKLRLFASAEQRFEAALVGATQDFEAQSAYGRFLLARGRASEAREHLEIAHKNEPPADQRAQRLGVRLDLAAARFADGKLDGAEGAAAMYDSALAVEARDSRALAGKLGLAVVQRAKPDATLAVSRDQAGFSLLLAQALADVRAQQWEAARDGLLAAADADPLSAYAAWRALSWLAEVTGYPADALRYVELALEAAPDDAWSLYQHGRLLAQRDDPEGARRAFKAALDRELAFTDAIAGLAALAASEGALADAELYFSRALELDPARAELEARRGFNLLAQGDVARAEACFQRAKDRDANEPAALAGLAWCAYRKGNPTGAIEQFRVLHDQRRALPETEPWRVFAQRQIERIGDHVAKEAWEDDFERTGSVALNDWSPEEAAGPTFALRDGAMALTGSFDRSQGVARLYRRYSSSEFVSLEMDVTVLAGEGSHARVGMFLTRERQTGGKLQATSKISVERHPEGGLQVVLLDRMQAEETPVDVEPVGGVPWWPAGKPVRLRIERLGEGSDSVGRISVDGIPVADGFKLGVIASTGEITVGLFARGDTGQKVDVRIDNVQVVKRSAR